jgi:hypothetical protein
MKKATVLVMVFLGCLVVMTGCRKDDMAGGIMLTTERFILDGVKTSVVDDEVHWVDGDVVRINGQTGTVEVSGSTARAVGLEGLSGAIRGYYPSSIITATGAANENTDSPTIVFPAEYVSSFSGDRQIIGLPMVARADEGSTSLLFYHLTAAIKVRVRNSTGYPIFIDSVVISTASTWQRLNGPMTVTLSNEGPTVTAPTSGYLSASYRRVKVGFNNNSANVAAGAIRDVQVPIPPISGGVGNNMTFIVYTHKEVDRIGIPTVNYDYVYSISLHSENLARNVLGTVQLDVTTAAGGSHVTEIDHSLFTINGSSLKVRFSKGNLKCSRPNTSTPWNDGMIWSFQENQYDIVETANVTTNYGEQTEIGLFGWGTKSNPWSTSAIASDYSTWNEWGENAIVNGGNTENYGWYTLSGNGGEWAYILQTRSVTSSGLPAGGTSTTKARYTKATVCGVRGLILFPDNYRHPAVTVTGSPNYNSAGSDYSIFIVDSQAWSKMQSSGAIFLPVTGTRSKLTYRNTSEYYSDGGFYWTRSKKDDNNSYNMKHESSAAASASYTTQNPQIGLAVRLVKNAE